MKRQSLIRRVKREIMKKNKATFTERCMEACRTGAQVRPVVFTNGQPK